MDTSQISSEQKCRVTKDYQAEFSDPIAVAANEPFTVSEKTSAWEENPAWVWVWCTDQRGKSGWTPKNIIQMGIDGRMGTASVNYNAIELTVSVGQELAIEQEESGWFWCRDQQGARGWVPVSHVTGLKIE